MGDRTGIQWTNATWNPVTGCTKVSAGCKLCYAERVFPRTAWDQCKCGHMHAHTRNGEQRVTNDKCPDCECVEFRQRKFTDVWTHADRLEQPLRWRKPKRIFVNSMSDLFHEDVPFEFIDKVFAVMRLAKQHTFQILTKRAPRMKEYIDQVYREYGKYRDWAPLPIPNVWLGVSAENQEQADLRILPLLQTPAACRFVSYEPALGPIDWSGFLKRSPNWKWYPVECRHGYDHCPICDRSQSPYVDWVIFGGESGKDARDCNLQWARSTRDQCKAAGTAFFMKQAGSKPFLKSRRVLPETPRFKLHVEEMEFDLSIHYKDSHGGDPAEWPEDLRIREYPK